MLCKKIVYKGFVFCCVLGTLCHFAFEWSGFSPIVAPFVPVNESVWEHLKLAYFPFMVYAMIAMMRYEKIYPNVLTAFALGTLTAMASMIGIFYGYTWILGHHLLVLDILTFLISIALGMWVSAEILCSEQEQIPTNAMADNLLGCFIFLSLIMLFSVFTTNTPDWGIFQF